MSDASGRRAAGHTDAVLDRRKTLLTWALVCFAAFAVVAFLVTHTWGPVTAIDDRGQGLESWSVHEHWLRLPLLWVEAGFATVGMIIWTALLAGVLLLRHHRRAALLTVAVMVVTSLATTAIKMSIGRGRPPWQNPDRLLSTQSFPSGHASSIVAFCALCAVFVAMLVRRRSTRQTAYAVLVVLALLVMADRVLLGRHYPSDVTGGALLGLGIVFLGLAVYSPLPHSHAEKADPLPEVLPSGRRLAVVLNPIKVEDVGQFESVVTAMAHEAGWSTPTWHYTTVEDPGAGMAEAAAVAGADLVIVCGGDGTVREVCAELAGTGVPVGIIPAGTGNLLARNLGIPLYIRAAIDVALTGQDRAIDMVEVGGDGFDDTHFMVMAGVGFDAAIMEGVNEDIKKRVGWLAYVLSALKSLMFPAVRVEIVVDDGEPSRHRARTVVVGNVGFLQAGMPLLPDAAIDDGLLDVVILHPRNLLSWVPLAWRVLLKRPHTDELVNRMTGRHVVLRTTADTPRQLDGDSIGPGKELRMTCVPGRLLVRVPR